MIRLLRNRFALSTVITTLIILVISILLASVLTYFAINVVSTRVQEENLHVSKQHIWVTSGGVAEGALMVTNIGGRDVVIDKIAVRGQECLWIPNVYYAVAATSDDLSVDLTYVGTITAGTTTFGGLNAKAVAASGDLILSSGSTIVIYINAPDSIDVSDIGLTVSIALHSAQAVYYSEVNIQATV